MGSSVFAIDFELKISPRYENTDFFIFFSIFLLLSDFNDLFFPNPFFDIINKNKPTTAAIAIIPPLSIAMELSTFHSAVIIFGPFIKTVPVNDVDSESPVHPWKISWFHIPVVSRGLVVPKDAKSPSAYHPPPRIEP